MKIDDSVFEKIKETENHIIYLQKEPWLNNQIDMIVEYKGKSIYMRTLLTDELFKLFFEPKDYQMVYMRQKQR